MKQFMALLFYLTGTLLKFSKNSYWLNAGFFSLLQNASNLVFGFGGFYLLVRVLNKPQMGAYTLFVTVASIVEVARVGFVTSYVFRKILLNQQ